jgi:hypothetical protein
LRLSLVFFVLLFSDVFNHRQEISMMRWRFANACPLLGMLCLTFVLEGCKTRDFSDTSEAQSQNASTPLSDSLGSTSASPLPGIGPVFHSSISSQLPSSASKYAREYQQAVAEFRQAYGAGEDPYQVVVLRATRFMERKNWDRSKEQTRYNPITATDKYNKEHNQGVCRLPDSRGRPTSTWTAFERASGFVDGLMKAQMNGQPLRWSESYMRLSHIRKWHNDTGKSLSGSSVRFDPDVLFSIHAAAGEGATQNVADCGKLGQVKVCDGHKYSPFFEPSYRPAPCHLDADWFPDANDWQALKSLEMRQLGQTVVPLMSQKEAANVTPHEYGISCLSSEAKGRDNALRYGLGAADKNWPGLKNTLPQYSLDALNASASELAQRSADGEVSAYAIYASVEQTWKDLFNYRLKPSALSTSGACSACGLKRAGQGYDWNDATRQACPNSCFQVKPYPVRDSSAAKSTDLLRHYFEPDANDPGYLSIAGLLQRHFREIQGAQQLSLDPIVLAARVQQWFAALHPFIDGVGRTSRFLMEMTLHSVGLPFPMLHDFWKDTSRSQSAYADIVEEGIDRHIQALKACSAYVSCAKKDSSFSLGNICTSKPSGGQCQSALTFTYGNGRKDTLSPCDCSTRWEKDQSKVTFAGCQ